MSFASDLQAGLEVEEQFVDFLGTFGIKAGLNSAINQKEMALYDVYDSEYRTYEVKYDRRAQETGNVFLEHESLYRTHATYVIYKLSGDDNFYILDTPSVKNILDNTEYIQKSAGGNSPYVGTLVPIDEFRKLFKKFSEVILPKYISHKTKKETKSKVASKKTRHNSQPVRAPAGLAVHYL